MKTITLIFLLAGITSFAQSPFNRSSSDTISRGKNEVLKNIVICIDTTSIYYSDDYKIEIAIDQTISQLPQPEYNFAGYSGKLKTNKGVYKMLLTLNAHKNVEDNKILFFIIKVKDSTDKVVYESSALSVQIKSYNESLTSYSYLGYVGTNFDLVDGIKAKNLFFAANVFVAPKYDKHLGFYLSLYGNRTVSINDSIKDLRRLNEVGLDSVNQSYAIYQKSDVKRNIESDNLGAYISVLYRLTKKSETTLYFSPSLEFIWRRNNVSLDYVNSNVMDTVSNPAGLTHGDVGLYTLPANQIIRTNTFDFNVGYIGLFLNHENERMSVRIHMSSGKSYRNIPLQGKSSLTDQNFFTKETLSFFTGRAWITEKKSGVTLQAEVYNTYSKPNPYYGITLSKAFDLDKLGTIFSPITSRN